MACLKAGNLTAAREKFSRCLKPPLDLNQLSHGSRLVQDVVEYLESTVRSLVSLVRAKLPVGPFSKRPGTVRIQGEDRLNPVNNAFWLRGSSPDFCQPICLSDYFYYMRLDK